MTFALLAVLFGCGSSDKGSDRTADTGAADGAVIEAGMTVIEAGQDTRVEDVPSPMEVASLQDADWLETATALDASLRDAGWLDAATAPDAAEVVATADSASAGVDLGVGDIDASRDVVRMDQGGDAQLDSGNYIGDTTDAPAVGVMSCMAVAQGLSTCVEYSGSFTSDQASQEQSGCLQGNASSGTAPGTFALAACPTGGSGVCANVAAVGVPAGVSLKYVYYSLTSKQAVDAQKVCTTVLGGNWTSS
jgi:hypothetical protein